MGGDWGNTKKPKSRDRVWANSTGWSTPPSPSYLHIPGIPLLRCCLLINVHICILSFLPGFHPTSLHTLSHPERSSSARELIEGLVPPYLHLLPSTPTYDILQGVSVGLAPPTILAETKRRGRDLPCWEDWNARWSGFGGGGKWMRDEYLMRAVARLHKANPRRVQALHCLPSCCAGSSPPTPSHTCSAYVSPSICGRCRHLPLPPPLPPSPPWETINFLALLYPAHLSQVGVDDFIWDLTSENFTSTFSQRGTYDLSWEGLASKNLC